MSEQGTNASRQRREFLRMIGIGIAAMLSPQQSTADPTPSITAAPASGKRTFCLVHGSTQGPGGRDLLAAELRQRGHRVLAPAVRWTTRPRHRRTARRPWSMRLST